MHKMVCKTMQRRVVRCLIQGLRPFNIFLALSTQFLALLVTSNSQGGCKGHQSMCVCKASISLQIP